MLGARQISIALSGEMREPVGPWWNYGLGALGFWGLEPIPLPVVVSWEADKS